jgi:hypothetical protein
LLVRRISGTTILEDLRYFGSDGQVLDILRSRFRSAIAALAARARTDFENAFRPTGVGES